MTPCPAHRKVGRIGRQPQEKDMRFLIDASVQTNWVAALALLALTFAGAFSLTVLWAYSITGAV